MIITKTKKTLQEKLYEAKMFCNTEEYCYSRITGGDPGFRVCIR